MLTAYLRRRCEARGRGVRSDSGWSCRGDAVVAELDEERDDGVEHDPLGRQQLAHVQHQLLRGDALALRVLRLEGRDRQLALGRGFHEAPEVRVVHGAGRLSDGPPEWSEPSAT